VPIPFLLLRHGQTTWNAERRWQGWADAPLSDLGVRQAVDAAAHLGSFGFTRACSSDLGRARDTAGLIAEALGLAGAVVVEPALRERHVGVFSGKTLEELLAEFPGCFDPETKRLLRVPDGESDDDLFTRAVPGLLALTERFAEDRLLVVSHGGVIRTIERHLGIDPGPSTPNLGGRWLTAVDGALVAGEAFVPIERELVTEPSSE
jgi:probable phosphoglycerate mutase